MSRNPSILIALLAVVVVLFGAKRLPDSARSLGKSMRIFKGEMQEMKDEGKNKDLGKASDSDKASDEK